MAGELGRALLALALVLAMLGGALVLAGRLGLPLGRLPGDLHWRGRHVQLFAPLGTSLVLSLLLSLVFAALRWFRR